MNTIKYYKIANTILSLDIPDNLQTPEHLEIFRENNTIDNNFDIYYFKLQIISEINELLLVKKHHLEQAIFQNDNLTICCEGALEHRILKFNNKVYAFVLQRDNKHYDIFIDQSVSHILNIDPLFLACFCLEKIFMQHNQLILHCAYVCLDNQAILFSAPSETGKTTQAKLWEKYRNTYQVNGDRCLLVNQNNQWFAYGLPLCGSSNICKNEAHRIRSIVFLEQAKQNRCIKLNKLDSYILLSSQIVSNTWNRESRETMSDVVEQIIRSIDICKLQCDISEDAVVTLEKYLTNNNGNG